MIPSPLQRQILLPALLLVGAVSALRAQEAVTVAPGRSVTLSAEVGGIPPFTYQWFKNGAALAGATSVTYQIPASSASDSGQYTVQVANARGSTLSPAASIFVGTLPRITTHPVGQSVALNGTVSLTVAAVGDPAPTYRWRRDGVVLNGATLASLTLSGVTGSDAGSYTVEVSNGTLIPAQTIVSNPAVLSVERLAQQISFAALPTRTNQDPPFTVAATASSGLPVSFSVVSGPATVSGSTVTLTGAGTVTLRASQAGNHQYAAATPVDQAFNVSSDRGRRPQTIAFALPSLGQLGIVPAGAAVTLTVSAEGGAPFTYVWRKDGAVVPGASAATLALANFSAADAGTYTAQVTNAQGATESDVAQLKLGSPQVVVPLTNKSVGDAPFTLEATASSGLAVTFTSSNPAVATVSGRVVTIVGAGATNLIASQPGNSEFSAAPPVERLLTVTTSFAGWQANRFSVEERAGSERSGPNAVYGLDDLPNLVKYALGLPPKVNVATERPALTQDGTRWMFSYERPEGHALGSIQYAVEVSTDLRDPAAWSAAGVLNEQVSSAGGKERWRATYPLRSATNPAGARVVAFRLRVTTPESTAYSPVLAGLTQELPAGQTTALSFPLYPAPAAAALMARLTETGPNFIEASGAAWTAATFGDGLQPHYVRIRSGASAGRVLPVLAAAGAENRLVVDSGGLPLARSGVTTGTAGDAFEVLTAQTLAGAFHSVALAAGNTAAGADLVQIWSGASWVSFYKHSTRNRWEAEHDGASSPPRDAYALRPDRGLRVRRGTTGPAVLYVYHAGRVADTAVRIVHDRPGSTFVALGLPVDATLASLDSGLGLGVAGGWRTGASPTLASSTADLLMAWNPAGNRWTTVYKNTGTARWEEARDGVQTARDNLVIPAGQPLLVRRSGEAGAQLIAVPLPYSVAR